MWSLYTPGTVKDILNGVGPLGPTSLGTLLAVSVLVAVPAVMIFLSIALPPQPSRWLNVLFAAVLTVIVGITMPGAWAFYLFMSSVEIVLQLLIVWYAWSWPKRVMVESTPA